MWCGRRARRNARPCCRCRRARLTAISSQSRPNGRGCRAGRGGLGQAVWRIHGRQQGIVQGRSGRDSRPDRPERLGQEHDFQHALRHARALGGFDEVRRRRARRSRAAPDYQPWHRPDLPDPATVPPADDVRECSVGRLFRAGPQQPSPGRGSGGTRARDRRPADRPHGKRRRPGRCRAEEARASQGAGHGAETAARRRKSRRARRDRDGSGG